MDFETFQRLLETPIREWSNDELAAVGAVATSASSGFDALAAFDPTDAGRAVTIARHVMAAIHPEQLRRMEDALSEGLDDLRGEA
jgi:hypothetical protein